MRVVLLVIGLLVIGLVAVEITLEFADTLAVDDSVNLWATILSYPDEPRSTYGDDYYEITLMNPITGQEWQIADGYGYFGMEGSYYRPKWSPHGQWLYWEVESRDPNRALYRAHWTGSRVETIQASDTDHLLRSVVSPEQKRAVWTTVDGGWDRYALYLSNANGSRLHELVHDIPLYFQGYQPLVQWSRDNKSVYVTGDVRHQLDVYDQNSAEIWRIQVPSGRAIAY